MLHLSSCHSATQGDNSFHSTRNCSYSVSNKAQTCATYICILLTKASSRCSTSYSYLLTFSWHSTSHYSSVFCDADYILMLNSVIEYNHESLYLTTAGPGWYRHCYIFSHHLSFYFSFLYRRMPFHTTIPKRIQTMWVQYGLLPPPTHTSACLKPQILPTQLPTPATVSCNPTPSFPFLVLMHPSPPSPSSGHRPLGCLCALARWHCYMVSWCDRAGLGWHACDSDFRCPPSGLISRVFSFLWTTMVVKPLCSSRHLRPKHRSHRSFIQWEQFLSLVPFTLKNMSGIQRSRKAQQIIGLTRPPLWLQPAVPPQDGVHLEPVPTDWLSFKEECKNPL